MICTRVKCHCVTRSSGSGCQRCVCACLSPASAQLIADADNKSDCVVQMPPVKQRISATNPSSQDQDLIQDGIAWAKIGRFEVPIEQEVEWLVFFNTCRPATFSVALHCGISDQRLCLSNWFVINIRKIAGEKLMVDCKKNVHLLYGLLVYLAWITYQSQPQKSSFSIYTQLTIVLVADLGLNKRPPRDTHPMFCLRCLSSTSAIFSNLHHGYTSGCPLLHPHFIV